VDSGPLCQSVAVLSEGEAMLRRIRFTHRNLLLGLLLACAPGVFAVEKIEVAAFEYPPIYQDARDKGLSGELVIAAFKAVGIDAELHFYPVARMVLYVSAGREACALGGAVLFKDPQVAPKVRVSGPIQRVSQVFLYDRRRYPSGIEFGALKQLRNYRIGALHSSGIMKYLQESEALALSPNTSHDGSAKQLQAGRIDLWAVVDLTGHYYMKKYFPDEAKYFAQTASFNKGDISLVCSRQRDTDGAYLQKFSEGLAQIRKNGTYVRIMAKYYGGAQRINPDAFPEGGK
jgi:ABC-type amino acid transport substrate-binding protein